MSGQCGGPLSLGTAGQARNPKRVTCSPLSPLCPAPSASGAPRLTSRRRTISLRRRRHLRVLAGVGLLRRRGQGGVQAFGHCAGGKRRRRGEGRAARSTCGQVGKNESAHCHRIDRVVLPRCAHRSSMFAGRLFHREQPAGDGDDVTDTNSTALHRAQRVVYGLHGPIVASVFRIGPAAAMDGGVRGAATRPPQCSAMRR